MKIKYLVIPILVVVFFTAIAAPPAHAELLTLTVILAAAFAAAIVVDEGVTFKTDTETASKPGEVDSDKQVSADNSKLELARQQ